MNNVYKDKDQVVIGIIKQGSIVRFRDWEGYYIIARVGADLYSPISLERGNRYSEPMSLSDLRNKLEGIEVVPDNTKLFLEVGNGQ